MLLFLSLKVTQLCCLVEVHTDPPGSEEGACDRLSAGTAEMVKFCSEIFILSKERDLAIVDAGSRREYKENHYHQEAQKDNNEVTRRSWENFVTEGSIK